MTDTIDALSRSVPRHRDAYVPPTAFVANPAVEGVGRSSLFPPALDRLVDDLRDLAKLEPNWDEADAMAIDLDSVDRAEAFLVELVALPWLPLVGPTTDGGVRVEWDAGRSYLSIDFGPDGRLSVACDVPSRSEPAVWRDEEVPGDLWFIFDEVRRSRR